MKFDEEELDKPEMGQAFYDANLHRISDPLETSPWLFIYEPAAKLISADMRQGGIADMGCGTGRFAKLLWQQGVKAYWGIDFSEARVNLARDYVPAYEFTVGSVFEDDAVMRMNECEAIVFLEVLEHLERDRELIASVAPGKQVIFSVPNYDSKAHVRWFDSADEIIERYHLLLDFKNGVQRVLPNPKREDRKVFLFGCPRTSTG